MAKKKRATIEKVVRWTGEEFDEVTARMWHLWLEDPQATWQDLATEAMKILPEERRRKASSVATSLGPIVESFKKRNQHLLEAYEDNAKLRAQIGELRRRPSEKQITKKVLENLRPEDIVDRVPINKLLEALPTPLLVGAAAAAVVTIYQEANAKAALRPGNGPRSIWPLTQGRNGDGPELPVFAMVGFASDRLDRLRVYLKGRASMIEVDPGEQFGPDCFDLAVVSTQERVSDGLYEWIKEIRKDPRRAILETGRGLDDLKIDLDEFLAPA